MKKNFLLIAGIGALLLIILNWQKIMAFASGKSTTNATDTTPTPKVTHNSSSTSTSSNTGPANPVQLLRKGSSGPAVTALQNMIIDGWGQSYLPKYGADGDFGSETESALKNITGSSSTTVTTFTLRYYNPQKRAVPVTPDFSYAPGSGLGSEPTHPWYYIPGLIG